MIRTPNFRSPGGEVVADCFVSDEHWQGVQADLQSAGVDWTVFYGEGSNLAMVKKLAPFQLSAGGATSPVHKNKPVPFRLDDTDGRITNPDQRQRLNKAWDRSVQRLCQQVSAVGLQIEGAGYGFCAFGLALPNPDYVPVVAEIDEKSGNWCWRETREHHERDPYVFYGESEVRRVPVVCDKMAVTLLYRECI